MATVDQLKPGEIAFWGHVIREWSRLPPDLRDDLLLALVAILRDLKKWETPAYVRSARHREDYATKKNGRRPKPSHIFPIPAILLHDETKD